MVAPPGAGIKSATRSVGAFGLEPVPEPPPEFAPWNHGPISRPGTTSVPTGG